MACDSFEPTLTSRDCSCKRPTGSHDLSGFTPAMVWTPIGNLPLHRFLRQLTRMS